MSFAKLLASRVTLGTQVTMEVVASAPDLSNIAEWLGITQMSPRYPTFACDLVKWSTGELAPLETTTSAPAQTAGQPPSPQQNIASHINEVILPKLFRNIRIHWHKKHTPKVLPYQFLAADSHLL